MGNRKMFGQRMELKGLLTGRNENKIYSGAVWNTLAGMMIAGQSAILLLFVSYRSDLETAGILSIAYASANLFYAVAQYGVRYFQVTDITGKYTFTDYLYARGITVFVAFVMSILYLSYSYAAKRYSAYKSMVVLEVVVWKLTDALEDVFVGRYQQVGRLGIAAKIMTLRLVASTGLVCVLLMFEVDIRTALLSGIAVSVIMDIWYIRKTFFITNTLASCLAYNRAISVLKECFPLCIAATLSIYIGNVPKYLIDSYMDEQTQAVFGYIMLPVFVVTLLSSFVYQPLAKSQGELWGQGKIKEFRRKVMIQCTIVMIFTISMVFFGICIGLPVLSTLYHIDLHGYEKEFLILLFGGGFYALVVYLSVSLTIVRRQRIIAAGNLAAAFFSILCGKYFIMDLRMTGAAVLYLIMNAATTFWYLAVLFYMMIKRSKGENEEKI